MYSDTKTITNKESRPLNVFVEPCAFGVDILPGETYSFTSKSEVDGEFEVEKREDGITLWGWQGTDILVKKGEEVVIEFETPFPSIGVQEKSWWQFWK